MKTVFVLAFASVVAFGVYYITDHDGFMNLVSQVQSAFAGNEAVAAPESVSGS